MTIPAHGILSRRALVKGLLATLSGLCCRSIVFGQEPKTSDRGVDTEEISKVEKLLTGAGLAPLHNTRSAHFLAVGNATETHQRQALELCEALENPSCVISVTAGLPWTTQSGGSP